jgi:mono/diheme cytochrome c family protein
LDLYWRIHSGIPGSGMANFGKALDNEKIWNVIHFLQALPYQAMREKFGISIN